MKDSLNNISNLLNMLNLNVEVRVGYFSDNQITREISLGEEQFDRNFLTYLDNNFKIIKQALNNKQLVNVKNVLGLSTTFIPSKDEGVYYVLTPYFSLEQSLKTFQEKLARQEIVVNEKVVDLFLNTQIIDEEKLNYLLQLLLINDELNKDESVIYLVDDYVKNLQRKIKIDYTDMQKILNKRNSFKRELLNAICLGDITKVDMLYNLKEYLLGDVKYFKFTSFEKKEYLYDLNELAKLNADLGIKDVYLTDKLYFDIKEKLDNNEVVYDIAKQYAALVDREKYKDRQVVVRNCIEYINNHIREKISLDDISSHLGVNKSYLSSVFNKDMEFSIVDYIHSRRISNACYLLESTDFSISEIADYIGYFDTSYFIRLFKSLREITPLKYREKTKK